MNNSDSSRRNFLKLSVAGMAIAGTSNVTLAANSESSAKAKPMDIVSEVDAEVKADVIELFLQSDVQ